MVIKTTLTLESRLKHLMDLEQKFLDWLEEHKKDADSPFYKGIQVNLQEVRGQLNKLAGFLN